MRTRPEELSARGLVDHLLRTLAANVKVGDIAISELRWLYSFVITARRARLRWTATDVQKRLVEQGVDEERAEELGQIYANLTLCKFKDLVSQTISTALAGIRLRYSQILAEDDGHWLDHIEAKGAQRARANAEATMAVVRDAIGF